MLSVFEVTASGFPLCCCVLLTMMILIRNEWSHHFMVFYTKRYYCCLRGCLLLKQVTSMMWLVMFVKRYCITCDWKRQLISVGDWWNGLRWRLCENGIIFTVRELIAWRVVSLYCWFVFVLHFFVLSKVIIINNNQLLLFNHDLALH